MNGSKRIPAFAAAGSAMRKRRYAEAIQLFRSDSAALNKDWRAMWDLGWCYYNLEKFSDAGKCFALADAVAQGNAICKWAKGLVYIKKRKYKKAEQVLLESLRLKERFHTRIALALAYLAQRKVSLAEKAHLDGIKIGTRLSERYESYAAFLSDVGREDEAEQMNQEARRIRSLQ